LATFCSAGVALAEHVSQVDPAMVPTGFLAAHNQVENIRISSLARAVERGDADVFIARRRSARPDATAIARCRRVGVAALTWLTTAVPATRGDGTGLRVPSPRSMLG
jgi:hypothetical protein